MGTPWVTQRGFKEPEMIRLADAIADLFEATTPYRQEVRKGSGRRAKVDFNTLERVKVGIRDLALQAGADIEPSQHGYPHFYYLADPQEGESSVFEIGGERVREFLNFAGSSDVEALAEGESQPVRMNTPQGAVEGVLTAVEKYRFRLTLPSAQASLAVTWLRDLSDGYVGFDSDLLRKVPGPVWVRPVSLEPVTGVDGDPVGERKPYYAGMPAPEGVTPAPLPDFQWEEQEGDLRRTPVFEVHKQLGAKLIPFAGWEMPVWYTSVVEEHTAVREAAGLFDVAHMGVYQAEGPDAAVFLDCVVGNDVSSLGVGESLYTHFLDPQAGVIDDLMIYHRGRDQYMVVVNASNDDKDWAWLNAVREGRVCVDQNRPWARAYGRNVILRNLRDPEEGVDMRVDIALQGPKSRDILLAMGVDTPTRKRILALKRTQLTDAVVGGFDLVVSRTGYTGEKMSFELFVHPDRAAEFFQAVLQAGEPFGAKPIGLGARDSLRTEVGLPLYGHEMGLGSGKRGGQDLGVAEGGFGTYVKTYKPWFIGREAFLEREKTRKAEVVRFRFSEKGVRMAHNGDPVLDRRGKVIGYVTSCAIDREGYLTGQAFVETKAGEEGSQIFIYQSAPERAGKAPAELKLGEKSILPTPAVVVSRFQRP
jgi:glycine hydroxymethyltransferase